MDNSEPSVVIIDDDESVRDALLFLMKSMAIKATTFVSAKAFLAQYKGDIPGCIVSDIRMPEMSGLELQQVLKKHESQTPIIFITGHGDIPMAVEAIKQGAEEFLTKPFRDQELLDCINAAMNKDKLQRGRSDNKEEIKHRLATLTRREHQVLNLIVDGKANKVIAHELNLSHRTIEVHRAHVMEKMQVRTLAELIKIMQEITAVVQS